MNERWKAFAEPLLRNTRYLRNPGLLVAFAGLALILDGGMSIGVFKVGRAITSWFEPSGVGRHIEFYLGITILFAGAWLFTKRTGS